MSRTRPRRRGRDERGRIRHPPRPAGHPARGRDDHAGARHPPRAPDRRALPRGDDLLRRFGRDRAPGQGGRPAGDLRRLDQPPHAERERHRRLPHLLQALAAAARTRTTGRRWSRRWPRASSTSSSPTTIRRTSRPSACPSPRPPTAPSASRPCSRPRLRLVHAGDDLAAAACSRALSTRPARILGLRGRAARRRRAGRPRRCSIPTCPTCSTARR